MLIDDEGESITTNTYVYYTVTIDRDGKMGCITYSYWSNRGSGKNGDEPFQYQVENVSLANTPADFQTLTTAAYEFKNNPKTRQKSFIQHLADQNKASNSKVKIITTATGLLGQGIKYIPAVSKIGQALIYVSKGISLSVSYINSEDPTRINIRISKYESPND